MTKLTSLYYLITGDNLKRFMPEVSVDELEKRATQKAGVINYLNQKILDLSKQKEQLEEAMAADEDVDIEVKIDSILTEIETVEKKIVDASEESRTILGQIFELNARLQEARFLDNRYKAL